MTDASKIALRDTIIWGLAGTGTILNTLDPTPLVQGRWLLVMAMAGGSYVTLFALSLYKFMGEK